MNETIEINKGFNNLKEDITKVLNDSNFNIEGYDLNNFVDDIRKKHIRKLINKFNTLKIERHELIQDVNHTDEKSTLNKIDSFKEISLFIENYFKGFSNTDRIKEITFHLDITKIVNKDKKSYYSLYDIKGDYTKEEFIKKITEKTKKEFCLSCWGLNDKYYRRDSISKLKQFLKLLLDVDINFKDEWNISLKDYETEINNNNKDIKIRFFSEWFYISFKDIDTHNKLLNYLLEQEGNRVYNLS